ncbi:MAG: hypothetical protein L3K17_05625 [Thermoplasmata archaeon]|nr:hypothetical protein [Thermoplasmata archaeon]
MPPPEAAPAPPAEEAARTVLRRLAPSRVALHLDLWKGAPPVDIVTPFQRAETAFLAGDWNGAISALDQLSVRFAEPRWPTMPEPFRGLRASIPAPVPPQWLPEHGMEPAVKLERKQRRDAEQQFALATATLQWMTSRAAPADDLAPLLAQAKTALDAGGAPPEFWEPIDRLWGAVRARVPPPTAGARPPPPPAGA